MLALLLALPFAGALLTAILSATNLPKKTPWVITMLTTGLALFVLGSMTGGGPTSPPVTFFHPWIPELGLNFSLWLDGPALFFAWLVLGLGFLIFLYAGSYMDPDDSPWRFFGTMLFFMGAMLGVVLSKNLLLMFVFWELTSISSFILIGHWHEKESARQGAVRALIVTGSGGLCLLAGIALLLMGAMEAGLPLASALEWDVLWENRLAVSGFHGALILMLIGAFTKSAQFPFHFWLPGAMEAPTPVSAFLHAATMVKAGIYLLGRLYPIFSDETIWLAVVGTTGVLTMLVGGFMAIMSRDLKQLLAHSTVSQLGLLTAYYGFGHGRIGTDSLLPLDLLLVGSHAFFKGALFMLVGVIDHGTHTRDWTRLGGLFKTMPVTGVLTIIGCASMAGLPLTLGFVAKELFLHKSLTLKTEVALLQYGLPALGIIASFFTAAYCYRTAISPFFGKPRDPHIHAHEGSIGLLFSPALLILICLVGGLWVPLVEGPIGALVNAGYYGASSGFHVGFFHHVDKLLLIAVVIFSVGYGVYMASQRIEAVYTAKGSPAVFRRTYEILFDELIPGFAKGLTHLVQSESLSRNMLILMAVSFASIGAAVIASGALPELTGEPTEVKILVVAILIASIASVYTVLTNRILLYRLIAMAPVGLFVAMFFLFYKAPDLALTQLLVEVVTLVVFLMLLWRMPQSVASEKAPALAWGRGLVAAVVGLTMGALTLVAFASPHRTMRTLPEWPTAREYYLENTKYPGLAESVTAGEALVAATPGYPTGETIRSGGGHNAVNVILVDFRGIDTMGEILVLGVAAIAVLLLLTHRRRQPTTADVKHSRDRVDRLRGNVEVKDPPEPIYMSPMWQGPSLIVAEVAKLVPGLMLLLGGVLYWIGHNEPGGGFIAGLVVSVALVLLFLSFQESAIARLHRFNYLALIPVGMLLAIITGLMPVLAGKPFLTSSFTYIKSSLFGTTGLATPMGFDLGVFLIVVGMTMLIVEKFRKE